MSRRLSWVQLKFCQSPVSMLATPPRILAMSSFISPIIYYTVQVKLDPRAQAGRMSEKAKVRCVQISRFFLTVKYRVFTIDTVNTLFTYLRSINFASDLYC